MHAYIDVIIVMHVYTYMHTYTYMHVNVLVYSFLHMHACAIKAIYTADVAIAVRIWSLVSVLVGLVLHIASISPG